MSEQRPSKETNCAATSAKEDEAGGTQAAPESAAPVSPTLPGGGWGEVAAVLPTGVIPNVALAIARTFESDPPPPAPYWADTLTLTTQSVCTAFVVLYLIRRSGEPWGRFGLVWPRPSDLLFVGPALTLLAWLVWELRWALIPQLDPPSAQSWFPKPKRPADYAMMALKYAANAFSEELVTRAYLVTRLEDLLKSRATAVLAAAMAFASYHAYQRADGLVDTLLLGAAWGSAYLFVRRIWPFVLAHAIYSVSAEIG